MALKTESYPPSLGFTLVELMVTLAVVAIVATVAVPSLGNLLDRNRMTNQGNSILGALQYARGEAVHLGEAIAVCGSKDEATCDNTGWGIGWIVFKDTDANGSLDTGDDDEILRTFTADTNITTISTTDGAVALFNAKGLRAESSMTQLVIGKSTCGAEKRRELHVEAGGRAYLKKGECP